MNTIPANIDQDGLAAVLGRLIKDHSGLGIRLSQVPFDWPADSHRLSGSFYYITFSADGAPTQQEFIEYIYDCLVPFCLPRKKIAAALNAYDAAKDYTKIIRLNDEARELFIKARSVLKTGGEPGELILYALLEWVLGAPRIASKMYLKTNANMPVHGTDGIHLGYDVQKDILTVYFGESKLFKTFAEGAGSAFQSITELINNSGQLRREIEILNNLSDLDSLPEAFRNRIADYINPYSDKTASLNKRIVHACLLGFEYPAYNRILKLKPSEISAAFEAQYRKRIASACRTVDRHYSKSLPPTTNLHLFLLPFPSLLQFRKGFYEKIGVVA